MTVLGWRRDPSLFLRCSESGKCLIDPSKVLLVESGVPCEALAPPPPPAAEAIKHAGAGDSNVCIARLQARCAGVLQYVQIVRVSVRGSGIPFLPSSSSPFFSLPLALPRDICRLLVAATAQAEPRRRTSETCLRLCATLVPSRPCTGLHPLLERHPTPSAGKGLHL